MALGAAVGARWRVSSVGAAIAVTVSHSRFRARPLGFKWSRVSRASAGRDLIVGTAPLVAAARGRCRGGGDGVSAATFAFAAAATPAASLLPAVVTHRPGELTWRRQVPRVVTIWHASVHRNLPRRRGRTVIITSSNLDARHKNTSGGRGRCVPRESSGDAQSVRRVLLPPVARPTHARGTSLLRASTSGGALGERSHRRRRPPTDRGAYDMTHAYEESAVHVD